MWCVCLKGLNIISSKFISYTLLIFLIVITEKGKIERKEEPRQKQIIERED